MIIDFLGYAEGSYQDEDWRNATLGEVHDDIMSGDPSPALQKDADEVIAELGRDYLLADYMTDNYGDDYDPDGE